MNAGSSAMGGSLDEPMVRQGTLPPWPQALIGPTGAAPVPRSEPDNGEYKDEEQQRVHGDTEHDRDGGDHQGDENVPQHDWPPIRRLRCRNVFPVGLRDKPAPWWHDLDTSVGGGFACSSTAIRTCSNRPTCGAATPIPPTEMWPWPSRPTSSATAG